MYYENLLYIACDYCLQYWAKPGAQIAMNYAWHDYHYISHY